MNQADAQTIKTVVLATRNNGKIREFSALLADFGLEVKGLGDFPEIGDIPETGETFLENARIKAHTVAKLTGLIAVADDSGLEVDALDGAPGVYSARYAGEDGNDEANNDKLLAALDGVPEERRTARFTCCMVAAAPGGEEVYAQRSWEGRIGFERAGDNGFGYDPLFQVPDKGCSSAQLSPEDKNARSHRGQAVKALLELWPGFLKKLG